MRDEQLARTVLDALARDPQPASSIDLALAVARGHRRRTRRRLAGVAVAVAVLAAGGTGLTALRTHSAPAGHHTTETGTLTGHLYGVGGPAPGSPVAWPGTITVSGNRITRRVPTGPDGSYTIPGLPPGSYTLTGHSPSYGGGTYPCRALTPARVRKGAETVANTYCEMR